MKQQKPAAVRVHLSLLTDAECRAEQIRNCIGHLAAWQQYVIEAYQSRDWIALGYDTWNAYVEGEFGNTADLLGKDQRVLVIAAMVEAKMSTRAIAAATGVNQSTVSRTIQASAEVMHDASPVPSWSDWLQMSDEDKAAVTPPPARKITGIDGKTYPALPAPGPMNRPALPPQFGQLGNEYMKLTRKLQKLREDDRYRRNKAPISDRCVFEIRHTIEALQALLDDLGVDDEVGR